MHAYSADVHQKQEKKALEAYRCNILIPTYKLVQTNTQADFISLF